MELSGNKGEWSEIYTLLRLLGDGKIHAGDAKLNKLEIFYPIISIIREESERHEYRPDTNTNVVIVNQNGHALTRIPMCVMLEEAEYLLAEIKNCFCDIHKKEMQSLTNDGISFLWYRLG